jgi:hypothetical protein
MVKCFGMIVRATSSLEPTNRDLITALLPAIHRYRYGCYHTNELSYNCLLTLWKVNQSLLSILGHPRRRGRNHVLLKWKGDNYLDYGIY